MTTTTAATDLYGGHPPSEIAAYSTAEVARYLSLPPGTVHSWVFGGRPYETRSGPRQFRPVIRLDDHDGRSLSFRNLVEIYVLSSVRRQHGVKLLQVRNAVRFLRERTRSEHPLAELDLQTDGIDLFIESFGQVVNASRGGQVEWKELVAAYLERVERDPGGAVIRLFPVTRARIQDAPRSISIEPRVQFGRPCLQGTGVPTAAIADRCKAGESLADLARDYGRPVAEIEEAVRYELPSAAA